MRAVEKHAEQARAATGQRLYSLPAARSELGLSRATLDREIAAGRIAFVKIRSRRYIAREDLERYIAARREIAGGGPEMREPDLGRAPSSRDDYVEANRSAAD